MGRRGGDGGGVGGAGGCGGGMGGAGGVGGGFGWRAAMKSLYVSLLAHAANE